MRPPVCPPVPLPAIRWARQEPRRGRRNPYRCPKLLPHSRRRKWACLSYGDLCCGMEAGTNAIHDAGIRLCRMHDIGGIGKSRASGDKAKTTVFQIAANEALTKIADVAGRQNIFTIPRTLADREHGIEQDRKCGMIVR